MSTKKQTAANRRNAQHSTGPKTEAGKARSSMNSLRHGLRARTIVLPDESQEEFDQLKAVLQQHYQPQNPPEQDLVDQMAGAKWKLLRVELLEAEALTADLPIGERIAQLNHLSQIQGRFERAWFKAYKELERLLSLRVKAEPAESDSDAEELAPEVRVIWEDENGTEIWYKGQVYRPVQREQPQPPPVNGNGS